MTQRVGIIGSGQLGAYLCRAAQRLDIHSTIYTDNVQDIAVAVADQVIEATTDKQAGTSTWRRSPLQQLVDECDVITFEKEAVATGTLNFLAKAAAAGLVRVAPSIDTMRLLQNKATQNNWLRDNGFATPDFSVLAPHTSFHLIAEQLGVPFVLKTQNGGYDGNGVRIVHRAEDMLALSAQPCIAEQYIGNRVELAVLVARSESGDMAVYPCCEMSFDGQANVLRDVLCPAQISGDIEARAARIAQDIVSRLEGVGLFAVEMFLQGKALWVNEISPRVHNAGHLTLESQPVSQFEQHIRAITGMPLGQVEHSRSAAMVNLLAEPGLPLQPASTTKNNTGAFVHWYGKQKPHPMRKMGHITALSDNPHNALQIAVQSRQQLQSSHV